MNEQAYDQKNVDDFEEVTERINEALVKIGGDLNIKPTITKLAELSSVHRNTISNREWPIERLKEIKRNRKIEEEKRKEVTNNEPRPIDVLTDKLERAHLEILYWFNEYRKANSFYEAEQESTKFLSKSKISLENKLSELKREFEDLKYEYERVCDLLNSVENK